MSLEPVLITFQPPMNPQEILTPNPTQPIESQSKLTPKVEYNLILIYESIVTCISNIQQIKSMLPAS